MRYAVWTEMDGETFTAQHVFLPADEKNMPALKKLDRILSQTTMTVSTESSIYYIDTENLVSETTADDMCRVYHSETSDNIKCRGRLEISDDEWNSLEIGTTEAFQIFRGGRIVDFFK